MTKSSHMHGNFLNENIDDFTKQIFIAAQTLQSLSSIPAKLRRKLFPYLRGGSKFGTAPFAEHAGYFRFQFFGINWFGDVAVHSSRKTLFTVTLHGVSRNGDDGHVR